MNVRLHGVRPKASARYLDGPIIIVNDSSYGNVVDGVLSHSHVRADADRNPGINLAIHKLVGKVGIRGHDWPVRRGQPELPLLGRGQRGAHRADAHIRQVSRDARRVADVRREDVGDAVVRGVDVRGPKPKLHYR
jgi:hypothetical protein